MPSARKMLKPFLVLVALFVLMSAAMPGQAHAAVASTGSSGSMLPIDAAAASLMGQVAIQKMQVHENMMVAKGFKQIGACWSKIQTLFKLIGGSNNVIAVLFNAIASQIMQYINQVCQTVLSLANQITQYAQRELQSLTCVPIPKLGLGVGQMNLGLNMPPPCNGVPLLGAPNSGAHQTIDWHKVLPQSSGSIGGTTFTFP